MIEEKKEAITKIFHLKSKQNTCEPSQSDMFYAIYKLRQSIIKAKEICEVYTRYPELLLDLTLEDLLIRQKVIVES